MNWKLTLIVASAVGVAYAVTIVAGAPAAGLVHALALALLPVLSGMLIGAVGVYLGSLGNLLAAMHSSETLTPIQLSDLSNGIANTVSEVRDDVLFSVASLAGVFFLELLAQSNIPGIRWPLMQVHLSKDIVLTSLSLTLVILSFLAVIDCVRVMFALHAQYAVLISRKKS